MKVNGRRMHLGTPLRSVRARLGTRPGHPDLAPRASVDADLVVIWYAHRDAPSLLPEGLGTSREDHTGPRGALVFGAQFRPWSRLS